MKKLTLLEMENAIDDVYFSLSSDYNQTLIRKVGGAMDMLLQIRHILAIIDEPIKEII